MKYDVTIGMPVFQSEAYVRRSLLSALDQSYASIEFLLIDDCGDDGSMDIIREIQQTHGRGKDIRILRNEGNMGVSASRNRIIDEAQGEYLYFMDSDDAITPDAISLLRGMVRASQAEIAFGSYEKTELTGKRTQYQYPHIQLREKGQLAAFAYRKLGGIQASACNYLVKTSVLRTGALRFIASNYWEDLAFTFNLVTIVSSAVLLPDITYYYYCRENSLSHYQQRTTIPKAEILQSANVIKHLAASSAPLRRESYFPNRCYVIMLMAFYVACQILKRRKDIVPAVSDSEIKAVFVHPASLGQIFRFRRKRLQNLALFALSKLPSFCCVKIVRLLAGIKNVM
jgi:glycosyltransferase involved in cell wall biosynthesis